MSQDQNPSINQYIVEMTKLLSFMSDWDRERALSDFRKLLESSDDPEALIESIGTPTSVAGRLAQDYEPSLPPKLPEAEAGTEAAQPEGQVLPEELSAAEGNAAVSTETFAWMREHFGGNALAEAGEAEAGNALVPPPVEEAVEPGDFAVAELEPKRQVPPALLVIYCLLCIGIGVPVFVGLLCIGVLPLVCGISLIALVVETLPGAFQALALFSDRMLLSGGALLVLAAALLLAWLGLWLSISLSRGWIGGVLIGIWKKLPRRERKEAQK